jgi:hypothetical protein
MTAGGPVFVGLLFALVLLLLGVGAGSRQFDTLRRVREEPYMPDVDKLYFRGQAHRRLIASTLLFVIGLMIAAYYLSGMDARMDEIGERRNAEGEKPAEPPSEEDRAFTRFVGWYVIVMVLLLGVVFLVAIIDFWATRVYWMARYREMQADHQAKLRRDLAVVRAQKLNARAPGLKPPTDAPPEGGGDGSAAPDATPPPA